MILIFKITYRVDDLILITFGDLDPSRSPKVVILLISSHSTKAELAFNFSASDVFFFTSTVLVTIIAQEL